ncbi:MAG: hypothetical protein ACD_2C00016G0022 [uncultured bacterium (gcode 4)]|uniref:Uncharacterized protein n=1 Tax=uncultured bacterium (gcode 4) TaxID=1234023 RepID=K2FGJ8_9BACT|nr:MAG: hypothetical protein ACD_2C00016G0022 [uncultured bacterium (gcode 4)]
MKSNPLDNNIAYLRFAKEALEMIVQYSKKVATVHGMLHPETHEVHGYVLKLIKSIEKSQDETLIDHRSIMNSLESLRKITKWFSLPDWACWTYAALYEMLDAFDVESSEYLNSSNVAIG